MLKHTHTLLNIPGDNFCGKWNWELCIPKEKSGIQGKNSNNRKKGKKFMQFTSWETQCCSLMKWLKRSDCYDYRQSDGEERLVTIDHVRCAEQVVRGLGNGWSVRLEVNKQGDYKSFIMICLWSASQRDREFCEGGATAETTLEHQCWVQI